MSTLMLAIETSNPSSVMSRNPTATASAVALAQQSVDKGVEIIAALGWDVEVVEGERRNTTAHNDDLLPMIDRLFRGAGLSPSALRGGRVAVSIGPGGYTSVRVACAAAKTIADACGARCVPVPTCLVAAQRFRATSPDIPPPPLGGIAVALAAKSESVWLWREPSAGLGLQHPLHPSMLPPFSGLGQVVTGDDAAHLYERGVRTLIADRHLPESVRRECERVGIALATLELDAEWCVRAGALLPDVDPSALNPLYPREPDAVTLWRARQAAAG